MLRAAFPTLPKVFIQRFQMIYARGETHQAINFSRTTFGKISNQGSENTECSESGLTPLTSAMVAAVMAGALGFSIPEPTSVTY